MLLKPKASITHRDDFVVDSSSLGFEGDLLFDWSQVATWLGAEGQRYLPAGTVVSKTAEGKLVPRSANTGDTAVGILLSDAEEARQVMDEPSQRCGILTSGSIRVDRLPEYGSTDFATYQTELEAAGTWVWNTYESLNV